MTRPAQETGAAAATGRDAGPGPAGRPGPRRLAARFGAKRVLTGGLVSLGLGQLWFAQLSPSGSYLVNIFPGLRLTAFGLGLLFPTISVLASAGVAPGERGLAGGLLAASQQVGLAVGLAVLATVAAARTRGAAGPAGAALASGYRLSYWIAAGCVACALAVVLLLLRSPRPETTPLSLSSRDNSNRRSGGSVDHPGYPG